MSAISTWSSTAASNNSSPPDGFPENMNPSDVNNGMREVMAAVRTQWDIAEWFDRGNTPTQTGATTFTIAGDVTSVYHVGRKLRLFGSTMGTFYGTILTSSFGSPNTTITLYEGTGSLTSNLSQVYVAIQSKTNPSISLLTIESLMASYMGSSINGLTMSNGTDSDHDIDVAVGACLDSSKVSLLKATSVLVKQIDSNWAEGTAAGGFPSGLTLLASTTYHYFIIGKADRTVDYGFDTSLTATNLLSDASDYTYYRRIGSVRTDGSLNIRGFLQFGDDFFLTTPELDINTTFGTTATTVGLSSPLGIKTLAYCNILIIHATLGIGVYISSEDAVDLAPSDSVSPLSTIRNFASNANMVTQGYVLTDTSSQIRIRSMASATTVRIALTGWKDNRV